jgi:hypothetical protein
MLRRYQIREAAIDGLMYMAAFIGLWALMMYVILK